MREAHFSAESKGLHTRVSHRELVMEFSRSDSQRHASSNNVHGESSLTRFYLLSSCGDPLRLRSGQALDYASRFAFANWLASLRMKSLGQIFMLT
jgi:hypothetical protein